MALIQIYKTAHDNRNTSQDPLVGNGVYRMSHYYTNSLAGKGKKDKSSWYDLPDQHPIAEEVIYGEELFYQVFKSKFGDKAKPKKGSGFRLPSDTHYSGNSHSKGYARDCNWIDQEAEQYILRVIRHDFEIKGLLFEALLKIGIRGFGRYETFVHIDARPQLKTGHSYKQYHYDEWGTVGSYHADKKTHAEFFTNYPEAKVLLEELLAGDPISYLNRLATGYQPIEEYIPAPIISQEDPAVSFPSDNVPISPIVIAPPADPTPAPAETFEPTITEVIQDQVDYTINGIRSWVEPTQEDGYMDVTLERSAWTIFNLVVVVATTILFIHFSYQILKL